MPPEFTIGLLGGTFDPVHKGHVEIVTSFLKSTKIDKLWILLTPHPPHKPSQQFSSYSDRLAMLTHTFNGFKNIKISTLEKELEPPQYTFKTIEVIQNRYPDNRFLLCIGEDSYLNFHKWRNYTKILKMTGLLVAARPGYDMSAQKTEIIKKSVHFVDHEPVDISSSQIREYVKNGRPFKHLVPQRVYNIIEQKNLYKN